MKCKTIMNVVFIAVLTYWISRVHSQYEIQTDPSRCCRRIANTTYASASCKATKLTANEFQQAISTPNFPNPFEPDMFCKWEIFARPGRRILIDIRNMHLISKDQNECQTQQLLVTSPLTGLSLGPYCGHDGLPNIVTTGNYVVVELLSPSPTNSREYKGFQMVYMETVQATSIGLRPPDWSDGMYLEYNKPRSPTTRRPSRFNPNRNRNFAAVTNFRPNPTTTTTPKPKTKDQRGKKRKPPQEKDRVMSNPNNLVNIVPVWYDPNHRNPNRIDHKENTETMGTAAIVGIIIGGIVVVAMISVVVAKLGHRSSKRRSESKDEERGKSKTSDPVANHKLQQIPSYWNSYSQPVTRPVSRNPQRLSKASETPDKHYKFSTGSNTAHSRGKEQSSSRRSRQHTRPKHDAKREGVKKHRNKSKSRYPHNDGKKPHEDSTGNVKKATSGHRHERPSSHSNKKR